MKPSSKLLLKRIIKEEVRRVLKEEQPLDLGPAPGTSARMVKSMHRILNKPEESPPAYDTIQAASIEIELHEKPSDYRGAKKRLEKVRDLALDYFKTYFPNTVEEKKKLINKDLQHQYQKYGVSKLQ